jgi:spermidine synthase
MHAPYLLIPISVLSLGAYLVSAWLVRLSLLSVTFHRKIWNSILLASFIVSGILGILLVIQVNYKLDWQFMKPLMKWHVDTGILMCLVATFHITWHAKYFLHLFRKPKNASYNNVVLPSPVETKSGKMTLWMSVLGFFSMVVQVLLIREISNVFQGNELTIGWTLGIWMFLTGFGSWLGRSLQLKDFRHIFFRLLNFLTWIPLIIILLMNVSRNLLFSTGEAINPFWFLVIILIFMAPVCIPAGFSFSLLVRSQPQDKSGFTRVYSLEAIGSLTGGMIVSLLLITFFSILQSLMLSALVIHVLLMFKQRDRYSVFTSLLLLVITSTLFLLPVDLKIKAFLYENQKVLDTVETRNGNITVCENGDEKTFYENGVALFSTGDIISSEEYVHYAMLQHPHPENVLLTSGEVAGMSREILKYPDIKRIEYIGLNTGLTRLSKKYISFPADERLIVQDTDGRRFLSHSENTYDIAIIAVPDPSSLQINRYYSNEFMQLLKSKLKPGAVVLYGISPAGNYMTPEKIKLEATVYHTLANHFQNVTIIPGERDYLVASDEPVSRNIGELSASRGISGSYVNGDYMDDPSIVSRSNFILEKIDRVPGVNSDKRPLPVFYHTLHYLSRFTGMRLLLTVIPMILILIPLFLMNPVSTGMFITGFTASSVEILLIFWFQVVFGNVYAAIGLIFALFMAGIAAGAAYGSRLKISRRHFAGAQLLIIGYVLLVPLFWLHQVLALPGLVIWLIFIPMLIIPAFLTGFQFVTCTVNYHPDSNRSAASIYAADLWGSALGAFVISTALVPLVGINGSCWIIAGLNGFVLLKFSGVAIS